MSGTVGITGTVPIEVLYAAGKRVVDLNNLFISTAEPLRAVELAERAGFPKSFCSWIKGIYQTVLAEGIEDVLVVTGGDCSNARLLGETLQLRGVRVGHFVYPYPADGTALEGEIRRLCALFGVTLEDAERMKRKLDGTRSLLQRIDELTYTDHKVSGGENHIWLVSASDFEGQPDEFHRKVEEFLFSVEEREGSPPDVRLAFVGVPPILRDFYDFISSLGADVVFNETQRQFACIPPCEGLLSQYLRFTYPYEFFHRFRDIVFECKRRQVDGIIHYTQSFCFRQGYTMLLKESLREAGLDIPLLHLEADLPTCLSAQQKTRLEAFVEMLRMGRSDYP